MSERVTFLAVVGESYRQDALARLLAAHPDRACLIALVPEPENLVDANAIKVVSDDDGAMLGYLSRKNAEEFHEAAAALNALGTRYQATIYGGEPDKPNIGVSFDAKPMYDWQDRQYRAEERADRAKRREAQQIKDLRRELRHVIRERDDAHRALAQTDPARLARVAAGPIGFRLAHELDGLLRGAKSDGEIVPLEIERVQSWLDAAHSHRHVRPFSELAAKLDDALADGALTLDECDDLLFLTAKLTTVNPYFDAIRAGTQALMGIVTGVEADGVVKDVEIRALSDWLDEWNHLRGTWPYDECESIVVDLLAGHPDPHAREYLAALAQQFPIGGGEDGPASAPLVLSGICAVDPDIEFIEKTFVFTGGSTRAERATMEAKVHDREGFTHPRVTQKTDYLVVCDEGCSVWAFACYGRKVEHAYELRREGHHVQIVAERDFWDALGDDAADVDERPARMVAFIEPTPSQPVPPQAVAPLQAITSPQTAPQPLAVQSVAPTTSAPSPKIKRMLIVAAVLIVFALLALLR
jgi:hypothetical protein